MLKPAFRLDAPHGQPTAKTRPSLRSAFVGRVRGKVLLLLCMLYFVTYVDRVNIATAAPFIKSELGLTNTQLGLTLSAFALPYAFFQIFGGMIGDRFGPRIVLGIVGVVWAVSTAATGFAVGLVSLFAARLALGFGEGASFPTATHAMAKWMPPDQRGLAQGVTHAAARLGNAITPLVAGALIALYGWRLSFWVFAAVSFLWVIAWVWSFTDSPADHPKMTPAELDELPQDQQTEQHTPTPWGPLLRRILPVTLVDFCYGWTLWVFLTWLPSFFKGSYGLDLKDFAMFSTLVLLAGVVGDTMGGVVSDALLRRTGNPKIARRATLVVGLMGSFLFVLPTLVTHRLLLDATFLALSFFFLELTNAVLWAIPMDIAPQHAGTAGGLMNTGFGIAGILSPLVFGMLLDATGSWQVPFAVSAALLFIGAVAALRIDPQPLPDETAVR
ncbi:MFS transporter [Mycobacterium simiae]|uniref:MFS transporter n=1 Tax=Mycobacterium simiae TaxID=1784 RepID=UPI0009DC3563|nr:MFS transporter [Mycobacterium simiae]PLV47900.1 MFS transporter [Mycobacterium tuberculosis variant microti OV254]BBX39447.1 MFS transporter [Mycobacterium simiae]